MNLINRTLEQPEPSHLITELRDRFNSVETVRQVGPRQWCIVCRDATDRIRLRIQYFFSARFNFNPVYLICPGDRA